MHWGCTIGSLFWAEHTVAFSLSRDAKSSSPHNDALLLVQSEMSCRRFRDLFLPPASRGHTIRVPYSYPHKGSSGRPWIPWDFVLSSFLQSVFEGSSNVPMISPPCCPPPTRVPPCLHCCATENSAITWGDTQLCWSMRHTGLFRRGIKLKSMVCWELGTVLYLLFFVWVL